MRFDPEDPRLTAYVLGELDEVQRQSVELLLKQSPEARALVDEIATTAKTLESSLAQEASLGLNRKQLATIRQASGGRSTWRWAAAAIAAGLLIAGSLAIWQISQPEFIAGWMGPAEPAPVALQRINPPSLPGGLPEADTAATPSGGDEQTARSRPTPNRTAQSPAQTEPPPPPPPAPAPPAPGKPTPVSSAVLKIDRNTLPEIRVAGEAEGQDPEAEESGAIAKDNMVLQSSTQTSQGRNVSMSRLPINGRVPGQVAALVPLGPAAPAEDERVRSDQPRARPDPQFNTEAYDRLRDNPFREVAQHPLSTFSIDVDTASYANVRRFLTRGALPPADAVRIEELINYFRYSDAPPRDDKPFAVQLETAPAPWSPRHLLVRIGLRGRDIEPGQRPPSNLVFLLDVSGSMEPANKLPLLKRAFKLLVNHLDERDRVAVVVYAGASGLALPSTSGDQKRRILDALEGLQAGGSTNGASGIQLAYQTAQQNYIPGGINRVILATDGDFNVGVTSQGELTRLIEEKAQQGVFLSVLGFGMGNYKDSTLEKLADQGNGNYAYIDTFREARKVLVEEMAGTLITIAKDVKIQVEFNPSHVKAYRLIGYENRILQAEDFNDDTRDAGEIGAGHSVTALYEVVPAGVPVNLPPVDPLKYQTPATPTARGELLTVKLRYKLPEERTSRLLEFPLKSSDTTWNEAGADLKFAAAVAEFGMLLRNSPYRGSSNWVQVRQLATAGVGEDQTGHRREFLQLVGLAQALDKNDR